MTMLSSTSTPFQPDLLVKKGEDAQVRTYDPIRAVHALDGKPLDNTQLLSQILRNTDIEVMLRTLGKGFTPKVYTLSGTAPLQIIPASKTPRGYIIINPAPPSFGFASQSITFFPSLLRAAAVYTSTEFSISNFITLRAFLDVTVNAGGTLVVDLQTRDPLTNNWATAQTDIFSGQAAVGTYYIYLGENGVDMRVRLRATVAVADITFSISGVMKQGIPSVGSAAGSTIFLGSQDVNVTHGYPVFEGQREVINLKENTTLYAIAEFATPTIKVFELQ